MHHRRERTDDAADDEQADDGGEPAGDDQDDQQDLVGSAFGRKHVGAVDGHENALLRTAEGIGEERVGGVVELDGPLAALDHLAGLDRAELLVGGSEDALVVEQRDFGTADRLDLPGIGRVEKRCADQVADDVLLEPDRRGGNDRQAAVEHADLGAGLAFKAGGDHRMLLAGGGVDILVNARAQQLVAVLVEDRDDVEIEEAMRIGDRLLDLGGVVGEGGVVGRMDQVGTAGEEVEVVGFFAQGEGGGPLDEAADRLDLPLHVLFELAAGEIGNDDDRRHHRDGSQADQGDQDLPAQTDEAEH